MDLIKLLNDLLANVSALQGQIVDLQSKLSDAQGELDKVAKESYDKGFADGVKSVPVSDKVFNQAEVDAMLASAVGPLNEKISMLMAEIDLIKANVQIQIDQAVNDFKSELAEKYEAMLVVEKQAETGFAELLKVAQKKEEKVEEPAKEIPPVKEEEAKLEANA
jgi:hypothetical protein